MKLNIEKINKELKKRKWNRSELSRQMKVDRQLVNHYLNHPINSMKIVDRLADILEVKPKDLII
jgi:DNA-binding Xre family transcriptional regulator